MSHWSRKSRNKSTLSIIQHQGPFRDKFLNILFSMKDDTDVRLIKKDICGNETYRA